MTAPTEAEIRAALTESIGSGYSGLDGGAETLLDPVLDSDMARVRTGWGEEFFPGADHPGTLWADMRPSEVEELKAAIAAVIRRVDAEATTALLEGCVAAAVQFAQAHPDIPRGAWPLRDTGTLPPAEGPR